MAAGILIHNGLYGIFRVKTMESRNYIGSFYELPRNKTDVLFVGSSHAYCGVQPNELWEKYGYSSYVLGCGSQSIPCSYYLIKEALTYQKPKVVFLEVYYMRYSDLYLKEGSLRHVTDGMRMGKAKLEMLRDLLKGMDWKEQASFYLPFIKYHSRWNDLQSYDFHTNKWLLGGNISAKIKKQKAIKFPDGTREIPETPLHYLDLIHDLCEKNDVRLVLFQTPMGKGKYTKKHMMMFNSLEEYCQERGIPFLFEQKYNLANIDYSRDFRNDTHMNCYGASKMTAMLGDYMTQNCALTDHRGDAAYRYWDECLASYLAYDSGNEEPSAAEAEGEEA